MSEKTDIERAFDLIRLNPGFLRAMSVIVDYYKSRYQHTLVYDPDMAKVQRAQGAYALLEEIKKNATTIK